MRRTFLLIYFVDKVMEKLMELALKIHFVAIKTPDSFRFFDRYCKPFSRAKEKNERNRFDVSQVKHLIQEFGL